MFNWFKKTPKGPTVEERLATLEENLIKEREAKKELESQLATANTEVSLLRDKLDEHDSKRNSTEPWVEIIGESIDPIKGIEIRLDWNDAFIAYLKENGITDKDDDTIVQKWLALLYFDLTQKFEQKIIEDSDIIAPNEYL